MAHVERSSFVSWHHQIGASLLGAYHVRLMLSVIVSLTLVVLCFHLPLDVPLKAIGWQLRIGPEQPMLDVVDVKTNHLDKAASGAPITIFGVETEVEEAEDEITSEEQDDLPAPLTPPPVARLQVRQAVMDFAEKPPDIVGGLGAYYIHIVYPEQAIAAGIEGRLILTFVVEPDGRPSQIKVLKSLHPLCDSSAVQALRKTRFVPGRQNGEVVRVRMRLPVQFKLIDPGERRDTTSTASGATRR